MQAERMDAVLPVVLQDLARARILLRSLARNFRGLGKLWVVTPADQVTQVTEALAGSELGPVLRVISELELVPELAHPSGLRGWYRQQLVKLAIAERVQSASYLTLDADVICVRPTTPEALAPGGRGLCHVLPENSHPDWYRGSTRVLGLEAVRQGILHNVTPAVLQRAAVLSLQRHLQARAQAGQFRKDWVGVRQRLAFVLARKREITAWHYYLMTGAPWTEYALYYTYLEATGQFDRYHTLTDQCIYAVEQSVWKAGAATFDSWDPRLLFEGEGAPYFAIVQSVTRLAPERVWAKVAPYLGPALD